MASFDVDKLTLECLVNKTSYHKYLAKKEPSTFLENSTFLQNIQENKDKLLELISQYIDEPTHIPHKNMKDLFQTFMIDCLEVIEKREVSSSDENEDIPKDDEMFSQCDDTRIEPKNPIEFWKMEQVFKKPN